MPNFNIPGLGVVAGGPIDLTPGGNTHVKIGTWSGSSAYNFLSLNGDTTAATGVGLFAGATGDGALYLAASNGFVFKNANTNVLTVTPTALSVVSGVVVVGTDPGGTALVRGGGAARFSGGLDFGSAAYPLINVSTASTVGAAGGASALPANPLGYLLLTLNGGATVKVPYYNN